MTYTEFKPHPALWPYIDAYWTAAGDTRGLKTETILPDGCIDIIMNLGDDCRTDNDAVLMKHEQAYLVGTMTHFKETTMHADINLLGIRFRPAAFSAFYTYASLHEITDQTIAFERVLSPDIKKTQQYSTDYLNRFFLNKLSQNKRTLLPVIADIQHHNGQLNVNALANRHAVSIRQLERQFKQDIGIGPKAFINIVRYQVAHQKIKYNNTNRSLLDIAFECGYYDHAHLTNDMKKYTGSVPSQW